MRKRVGRVGKNKRKRAADRLRVIGYIQPVHPADDAAGQGSGDSCMRCGRLIGETEVRILPSRYVQERNIFGRHGAEGRLFMCLDCHERIAPAAKRAGAAREVQAVLC